MTSALVRVLAAAEELGYVRNSSARSLRRTERVCLVVRSVGVPAYDQLARDLSEVADGAIIAPSVPYLTDGQLRN